MSVSTVIRRVASMSIPKILVYRRPAFSQTCCEVEEMRRSHSGSAVQHSMSTTSSLRVGGTESKIFDLSTSKDQEENVLGVVNTLSAEELYKYEHITKQIAAAITKQRRLSGLFSSLQDLIQVPGITEDRLEKITSALSKKILKSSKSKSPILAGLGALIHPRLKLTEVPSSVVAVHIQLPHVSWVKLKSNLEIDDWCTASLTEDNKPLKYDHASYQAKLWKLCQRIPPADVYLLEDMLLRVSTTQIMPTLNRNYAEATITTILNSRQLEQTHERDLAFESQDPICSPDGKMIRPRDVLDIATSSEFKHSVYKLKPKAVSSYFSILVGGERIGALDLLRNIRDGSCPAAEGVIIEQDVWQELCELPKALQDQRAQSLLIATAFYKLLTTDKSASNNL